MNNKKIGIVTWHYYDNFGSALQAYALLSTVKGLGYDTKIVNYRNPRFGTCPLWKERITRLIARASDLLGIEQSKFCNRFYMFRHKYLHQTLPLYSFDDYLKEASRYDVLIFGSDQIWAPNVFNSVYMGDHLAQDRIPMLISYAASIGLNEIPEEKAKIYSTLLKRFQRISVRETDGSNLLRDTCGIESSVVLDPTLLLPSAKYRSLHRRVEGIEKPYILCYFLNGNHNYQDAVLRFAEKRKLTIYGISEKAEDHTWMKKLSGMGPREFLWLIDNAQVVITDSYHGTIFSMIYHKEVYTIERFSESDTVCQNSRLRELNKNFQTGNRIVRQGQEIQTCEYDYDVFERKLMLLREKSLKYLSESLSGC